MMRALVATALALLAGLAGGCNGIPDRVEGAVRFRDAITKDGRGGKTATLTTVTETAVLQQPGTAGVTRSELAGLLRELDQVGLFSLAGRPEAPREGPPGSITVDTDARRFFVTIADLRTKDESACFTRAAARILLATQAGPHYSLPK
jgi:hypothetical protein